MKNLKETIIQDSGLSEDQAEATVNIVRNYFKSRLPGYFDSVVDRIIEGESLEEQFRNRSRDITETARLKAESLANDMREAFKRAFG